MVKSLEKKITIQKFTKIVLGDGLLVEGCVSIVHQSAHDENQAVSKITYKAIY